MTSLKVVIHFQWTLKSFLSIASINSSIISDSTSDLLFWDIKTGITFDLLRGEQAHCISEIASLFVKYTHGCHDGAKNIFESSVMHQTLRSFMVEKLWIKTPFKLFPFRKELVCNSYWYSGTTSVSSFSAVAEMIFDACASNSSRHSVSHVSFAHTSEYTEHFRGMIFWSSK